MKPLHIIICSMLAPFIILGVLAVYQRETGILRNQDILAAKIAGYEQVLANHSQAINQLIQLAQQPKQEITK